MFIYPKLPAYKNLCFVRIGGNGLANCLFVYAKAIVASIKDNAQIIAPTWVNLSLGTYLRGQSDKRSYIGLFNTDGEITGIKRIIILGMCRNKVKIVSGIYDFFVPILEYQPQVSEYIFNHIRRKHIESISEFNFTDCVAVHVRLGDFPEARRVPLTWYKEKINSLTMGKNVLLFSDGSDSELIELLSMNNVKRVFFGSSISDIIAISKCELLIGSDSSFSAWGAYLGQVPCVFYHFQFGQVLLDGTKQIVENPV